MFLALSAPPPPQARLRLPRPPLWVVGPLSPLAREVREGLFSVCGGFLAALGAPRVVQRGPGRPKAAQKPKSEFRWLQKWRRGGYF